MTKRYDAPATSRAHVLPSEHVGEAVKHLRTRHHEQLNPVALKRQVTDFQRRLYEVVSLKESTAGRDVQAPHFDDILT